MAYTLGQKRMKWEAKNRVCLYVHITGLVRTGPREVLTEWRNSHSIDSKKDQE